MIEGEKFSQRAKQQDEMFDLHTHETEGSQSVSKKYN